MWEHELKLHLQVSPSEQQQQPAGSTTPGQQGQALWAVSSPPSSCSLPHHLAALIPSPAKVGFLVLCSCMRSCVVLTAVSIRPLCHGPLTCRLQSIKSGIVAQLLLKRWIASLDRCVHIRACPRAKPDMCVIS